MVDVDRCGFDPCLTSDPVCLRQCNAVENLPSSRRQRESLATVAAVISGELRTLTQAWTLADMKRFLAGVGPPSAVDIFLHTSLPYTQPNGLARRPTLIADAFGTSPRR